MHDEGGRDGATDPDQENSDTNESETRAAIEAALTADTYNKLVAFTRKRCAQLRRYGFRTDSDYPEQLAANVIADTYSGDLTWPRTIPLDTHLCQSVKSRTNAAHVHQSKFPKFHPADDEEWDANVTPHPSIEHTLVMRELVESVTSAIEHEFFVRRDLPVLAIVQAWRVGETRRRDVARFASLNANEYDNARVRIRRFLQAREVSET